MPSRVDGFASRARRARSPKWTGMLFASLIFCRDMGSFEIPRLPMPTIEPAECMACRICMGGGSLLHHPITRPYYTTLIHHPIKGGQKQARVGNGKKKKDAQRTDTPPLSHPSFII